MPRLESGVLAIVGEAEELAFGRRNRAGCAIHPTQCTRHQQGRCGAPPLCRQTRKLVNFACLAWRLILAGRAEAELARQEPRSMSSGPDGSARINRDFLWCRTA